MGLEELGARQEVQLVAVAAMVEARHEVAAPTQHRREPEGAIRKPRRAAEEGLAIAREIAAEIRPVVQGVQISTAPRALDTALGLIEAFLAPVQAKGI